MSELKVENTKLNLSNETLKNENKFLKREILRRQTQFEKEKRFNDKVINSLPGIFYLYKKESGIYKLKRWNRNHENIYGYTSRELKNMKPTSFLTKDSHENVAKAMKSIEEGGFGQADAQLQLKDGIGGWFHFEGYGFIDDGSHFFLGMGVDISKRVQALAELRDKSTQLLDRNKKLSEYAFHNAHILRSPVCRLLGLLMIKKEEGSIKEDYEIDRYLIQSVHELDQLSRNMQAILSEY
ncbi:PAS domain S-box protein [Reichenbachiella faecimaris]|uniref:PAS domain S-box protein n=1 Tax=Reichenbachiella faecimaris TaxID=692418 RepID=UPI001594512E|nr:PAS domain S-box protein [Reichenbachiella faecimaris]